MTKSRHLFACLAVALVSLLAAGSAYALNDHSWVSSTGSGTTCTRAAPCSNFSTAHDATNAGGVISVLDSGDYTPPSSQNLWSSGPMAPMVARRLRQALDFL